MLQRPSFTITDASDGVNDTSQGAFLISDGSAAILAVHAGWKPALRRDGSRTYGWLRSIQLTRIPVLTEYALRSARDRGGSFRREYIRAKSALKVSIRMNCPSNSEFFCKIHVDIAVNVRFFSGHFVHVSFVFIHIPGFERTKLTSFFVDPSPEVTF